MTDTEDSDVVKAGLAYVRGKLKRQVYTFRNMDKRGRARFKLPTEMTNRTISGEFVNMEIEVVHGRAK